MPVEAICQLCSGLTSAAKHRHSWFPRWLISQIDAVIATTPDAASFGPNTTRVVPHGASLERFSPPDDKLGVWQRTGLPGRYCIGVFGRVRPSKGTDIYVDAMLQVLPRHPDFTAFIVGLCNPQHAAYKAGIQQKIDAAGMGERIRFLGEMAIDEVPLWYQNALIAVACPRYEPFGITPLEAMASGCAVIASDTGAFRMIVEEGETGTVVPTHDVQASGRCIGGLSARPTSGAGGRTAWSHSCASAVLGRARGRGHCQRVRRAMAEPNGSL